MTYRYNCRCGALACDLLNTDQGGRVIAVHSESVYIRTDSGRLLLICPDRYGSVPFGVSVGEYTVFRSDREYREGDSVTITDMSLCFADGDRVCFTTEDAPHTRMPCESLPDDDTLSFCAEYIRDNASVRGIGPALGVFLCYGVPSGSSNVYALGAAAEADRLERALVCGEEKELTASLRRFIGLGYGLTPSGDDFVCGMMYAFSYWGRISDKSRGYADMLSAAMLSLLERTNEVSAEYIRCAAENRYFEVIEGVLGCLGTDAGRERLSGSLASLLAVGASSGSDILCGILFASFLLMQ